MSYGEAFQLIYTLITIEHKKLIPLYVTLIILLILWFLHRKYYQPYVKTVTDSSKNLKIYLDTLGLVSQKLKESSSVIEASSKIYKYICSTDKLESIEGDVGRKKKQIIHLYI